MTNGVPRSAVGERETRTDSDGVRNFCHRSTLLPESHFSLLCRYPFLPAERWYRNRSRQGHCSSRSWLLEERLTQDPAVEFP